MEIWAIMPAAIATILEASTTCNIKQDDLEFSLIYGDLGSSSCINQAENAELVDIQVKEETP